MRTTRLNGQVNLTKKQEREIDRLFRGMSEHRGRRNLSNVAVDETDDEVDDQDPGMADGYLAAWRDEGRNDHLDGDPITGEDPFRFPDKAELRETISDTSASFGDSLPGPQERVWHGPSSLVVGSGIQFFVIRPQNFNGDGVTEATTMTPRGEIREFRSNAVAMRAVPICPCCEKPIHEDREIRHRAQFMVHEAWVSRKQNRKPKTWVCGDCHYNRSPRGNSGLFTKAEREKLRIMPPPPLGDNMHYALKA